MARVRLVAPAARRGAVAQRRALEAVLLFLVPSTLGDFLLRLALASLLTVIAAVKGWGWLAFAAATLAVPTLWLARLAPLVAVPRLWLEERDARPTV